MPTRTARTAWNGDIQQGSGRVELASSGAAAFDVSFPRRAADDAQGVTSPEELIAAAHSSCYAMAFSLEVAEELARVPALRGLSVGVLHGQMPPADKEKAMADFQLPPELRGRLGK